MEKDSIYPDIKASLYQHKRQAPLSIRQAYPDLAVHEQPVVHVYDFLLRAVGTSIDFCIFLPLFPSQSMESQQISVFCLEDMFLRCVAEQGT